ncbi:LysR family transcriptional regulator [Streptomyces sp. HC44]|uniref:LysR family transcriptional regulator n=1 Tax=Streptomyces scabichelini TaxID=2711217 RepID=A0A6G4UXQ1_9ACTN|nr:LysR substrate-binding domain-containing protein [Streptomyces scabichelini]NGO06496.1 LysR family transcriptional regulator [Streptomyces scabichelini]
MDVRVQDLRYFAAVADELSFTRAAERLYVSQPALSKQIRRLESALRARLFERDRRTVVLTPAGETLLPVARQMVEAWDDARRMVAETAAARQTALTVGFQTRIGRGLIPTTTARLQEVLPDWRLHFRQVSWDDPTAGLASGETDVAIAWLPVPDSGLSWKVVSEEERWVALPRGHRLSRFDVVPFADFAGEPVIALPLSAGPLRDFWLAAAERTRPARIAAEAETAEETFEAVASGLGVVLVAAGNAGIYERDDIAFRPVSGLSPSRLAVVWRTADERKAVRTFVDACVQCLCDGARPPSP